MTAQEHPCWQLGPGDWVADRYQLRARLGHGGMGDVFAAHDRHTGADVAIKLLRTRTAEDRKRMLREARTTATISHPNVVSIWEIGLVGPCCFLALELLEGETVAERLARSGAPPLAVAHQWLASILDALAATHAAGTIHRDLKPENLFLDISRGETRLKLIDFGLSKGLEDDVTVSEDGAVVGTPGYMAPEQIMALDVDERTDVYGFAITAYEVLTGQRAFGDDGITTMLVEMPPPPSTLRDGIPEELDGVILRALAKRPDQRYAHIEELRSAWRAAVGRQAA